MVIINSSLHYPTLSSVVTWQRLELDQYPYLVSTARLLNVDLGSIAVAVTSQQNNTIQMSPGWTEWERMLFTTLLIIIIFVNDQLIDVSTTQGQIKWQKFNKVAVVSDLFVSVSVILVNVSLSSFDSCICNVNKICVGHWGMKTKLQ
mgnify:CR=1 FL=1